jgi:hypothetical protein
MADWLVDVTLHHAWVVGVLLVLLTSADRLLTVAGARTARRETAYGFRFTELNPLHRDDISRLQWASLRFFLTLSVSALVGTVVCWSAEKIAGNLGAKRAIVAFLLANVIFGKTYVLANNLHTLVRLYLPIAGPAAPDLPSAQFVQVVRNLQVGAALGLCALVGGSVWLAGGATSHILRAPALWRWYRRETFRSYRSRLR